MSMLPAQLEEPLRLALAPRHQLSTPYLAQLLVGLATRRLSLDEAHQRLVQLPEVAEALRSLAGRSFAAGGAAIVVGELPPIHHADVVQQITIQAGGAVGSVVGQQIAFSLVLPPPPSPPITFQVPYPENPLFRGRDADLLSLGQALLADGHAAQPLPALAGMGGVGKTQLAVAFAQRYRSRFPGGVFWLSMADPEGVAAQVAACAGPGGLSLPGWQELGFDERVAAVRQAWDEPVGRLIVFDNLEDPRLLSWRPRGGGSRVLITTRRGSWPARSNIRVLRIGPLARADSVRLLLSPRARGDEAVAEALLAQAQTIQEADAIAALLGDLPLALTLAGGYLESRPSLSLASYRTSLEQRLLADPSLQGPSDAEVPAEYTRGVAASIALSYDQLDAAMPRDALALALLRRAALCAPAPVPRRLLDQLAGADAELEATRLRVDEALARLGALGLMERSERGDGLVHQLVGAYVRLSGAVQEADEEAVARAVVAETRYVTTQKQPQAGQLYLAHLSHLVAAAWLPRIVSVLFLNKLGQIYQSLGDYAAARRYCEQALQESEAHLDPSHYLTGGSINNLAEVLRATGRLQEARAMFERAYGICSQSADIPEEMLATILNNLGLVHGDLGEYAAARGYIERALEARTRVLGPEHPETGISWNCLGTALQRLGDMRGARAAYERGLAIRRAAFGDDHPDTATNLQNLGALQLWEGDLSAARATTEVALAIRERIFGPEHPDVASSLNALGVVLRNQGDLPGAQRAYERALAIRQQVFGLQHPETAQTIGNIGTLLLAQGQLAAALASLEQSRALREQIHGRDHLGTVEVIMNIATTRFAAGDGAGARQAYAEALAICETLGGPYHPQTITTLGNYGSLLMALGEPSAARPLLARCVNAAERTLGPEHPDTALWLNNLGAVIVQAGDLPVAEKVLARALSLNTRLHGAAHPNTALTIASLGSLEQQRGNLAQARERFLQALASLEPAAPAGHPVVAALRQALAATTSDAARGDGAADGLPTP